MEVLGVAGAGVSLGDAEGGLRFVTATDERIVHVEERQIAVGQGPCHDAFTSGDLAAEERWPDYTQEALNHGCRAVAGIPMLASGQGLGALNLYARQPREWPADEPTSPRCWPTWPPATSSRLAP